MMDIDWDYLRKALILFCLCAATGMLLVVSSNMFVEQQRNHNNASQSHLNTINGKYRDAVNQLKLVEDYLPGYIALKKQGFVGEENRLQWVEALNAISKNRKVPAMDYDIKAIRPYAAGATINTRLFQVYASEMNLKMKLTHERDLLDILGDIEQKITGVYNIHKCNLQRSSGILSSRANAVNILAECTLGWFTIKPKN